MPSVRGIEVVYRYVTDMARAIAFYENAFGLSFVRHGDDWAECTSPTACASVFISRTRGSVPQVPGSVIVDLRVDDLAASHARLAMLGGRPGDPQDAPAGRFVTFVDPDGYRVQVFEKKR